MKIYKLYEVKYHGGIGESVDEIIIGYFDSKEKAMKEALAKTAAVVICYPNELNKYGWKGKYVDLNGLETGVPYEGFVVEEIEVK